jgi:hypothetical protein
VLDIPHLLRPSTLPLAVLKITFFLISHHPPVGGQVLFASMGNIFLAIAKCSVYSMGIVLYQCRIVPSGATQAVFSVIPYAWAVSSFSVFH